MALVAKWKREKVILWENVKCAKEQRDVLEEDKKKI